MRATTTTLFVFLLAAVANSQLLIRGASHAATASSAMVRCEPYSDHRVLLAYHSGDDAHVYLARADFSDAHLIYTSVGRKLGQWVRDVAFVDAPRRWAIVLQDVDRSSSRPSPQLSVHVHDAGDTRLASGTTIEDERLVAESPVVFTVSPAVAPIAIGGTTPGALGDTALLGAVQRTSVFSYIRYDSYVATIDVRELSVVGKRALAAPSGLVPGGFFDIAASRGGSNPWLVTAAHTTIGFAGSAGLVSPSLSWSGWTHFAHAYIPFSASVVETSPGRYIAGTTVGEFTELTAGTTRLDTRVLTHALGTPLSVRDLAWDATAQQICGVVASGTNVDVVRATQTLCEIERYPLTGAFGTTYDRIGRQFIVGVRTASEIVGYDLIHDPALGTRLFGTSCAGLVIKAEDPFAGSRCRFVLRYGETYASASLMLSAGRRTTLLPGGCSLYVDESTLAFVGSTFVQENGEAILTVPLPDCPVLIGNVFAQWIMAAGEGRGVTTPGLMVRIRP
ncbi:MAG: hypothetical protein KDC95_09585 [Planctomycetes bacterium]|nr:hypothetical protein [Planctomycetota bacterium]